MFTGIIETQGTIQNIVPQGTNQTYWISSSVTSELKADQSVAHDGVCLTVEEVQGDRYRVTAVHETLVKTCLIHWKTGEKINIERALLMNGRLDGHIVQGHVDATAECVERVETGGSWLFRFRFSPEYARFLIEKGSVCINGVSLTVIDLKQDTFGVAIIPYTFHHTNFQTLTEGRKVNIEFDVIGKYINRIQNIKKESV